ncbi:5092_t:CDS:2 [Gigaspora margarita]|uniref:5092_t:CDS:1 n=1 Tax=Gigaspora margarita TaxID=4874 RepID=A0ABN7UP41_GIGMA|nr:5092_t:CDS:2 [Gigaspora margarita]
MDTEKALEIFNIKNNMLWYKICQFAVSELLAITHISVNFDGYLLKKYLKQMNCL